MFKYTIIKSFLSEAECEEIINSSLNNLQLKTGMVGGNDNPSLETRKSKIAFFNCNEKFPTITKKIIDTIQKEYKFNGFNLKLNDSFQFTEYKTDDFFNWHTDYTKKNFGKNRVCSMIIQLNNEYSGGDFELKDENGNIIELERGTGNLFIFLSDIEHRVKIVTSGVRYSLVNWLSTIPIDNYKKTLL
jgi:PKHD-type hydroxylase